MAMPFEMIFSIFLVIIFIVVAFIAINYFLDLGKCGTTGKFYENLQIKINEAYSSDSSSFDFDINLPSGIEKVCFANINAEISNEEDFDLIKSYNGEANLFLIPSGKACNMPYKVLKNINITEITKTQNPYCIDASGKLRITKDIYDSQVLVK